MPAFIYDHKIKIQNKRTKRENKPINYININMPQKEKEMIRNLLRLKYVDSNHYYLFEKEGGNLQNITKI